MACKSFADNANQLLIKRMTTIKMCRCISWSKLFYLSVAHNNFEVYPMLSLKDRALLYFFPDQYMKKWQFSFPWPHLCPIQYLRGWNYLLTALCISYIRLPLLEKWNTLNKISSHTQETFLRFVDKYKLGKMGIYCF